MEASPTAKRLVFASSVGIFGDVQNREPPLRVDTPVSPTDEYGRQKVACEKAIQPSRLQWSILRLAAVSPIHLQAQDPSIMFEFSPDARFEFLHPADAGTAFARAVACEGRSVERLYVGGGPNCRMTYYDFTNALMSAIGIGPIPVDAFVRRNASSLLRRLGRHRGKPAPPSVSTARTHRAIGRHERGLRHARALHPSRTPARDVVRNPQLCLPQGEPAIRSRLAVLGSLTLTSILPMLAPVNSPLRASTQDSMPSKMVCAVHEPALVLPLAQRGEGLVEAAPLVERVESLHQRGLGAAGSRSSPVPGCSPVR